MPIIPAGGEKYTLKVVPQFEVTTLTELQPLVDASPATYEGMYIRALDQAAGDQIYYVEEGQVIPAYEQGGYDAETSDGTPDIVFYDESSQLSNVVSMILTGTTDANGIVTVYPTDDGTQIGTDRLSSVLSAYAVADGGNANPSLNFMQGNLNVVGPGEVEIQMLQADEQVALLGRDLTPIKTADAGVTVRVTVFGIAA